MRRYNAAPQQRRDDDEVTDVPELLPRNNDNNNNDTLVQDVGGHGLVEPNINKGNVANDAQRNARGQALPTPPIVVANPTPPPGAFRQECCVFFS